MGSGSFFILLLVILTKSNVDSTEIRQHFAYSHPYAPSSVDFHDIYPHGNAALSDEQSSTTEEDFHLNTITTQFVEFRPEILKIQPITTQQRVPLNSSSIKNEEINKEPSSSPTSSSLTTTQEPDVIPLKLVRNKHHQRGVLDLLLPASRVRTFKSIFDTFRRMLSYTFKRK